LVNNSPRTVQNPKPGVHTEYGEPEANDWKNGVHT
jgi:hypothetical protein